MRKTSGNDTIAKSHPLLPVCLLLGVILLSGCSSEDPVQPATGLLRGIVSDAGSGVGLPGVRILVFDANSNTPVATLASVGNGTYGVELTPGTFYAKFSRQGYEDLPPKEGTPFPVNVYAGQATDYSVSMSQSAVANGGSISGRVMSGGTAVPGALVVAESGPSGFSALTGVFGTYAIFNVPPGSYRVKAWLTGYNSNDDTVLIQPSAALSNIDLTMIGGITGIVSGKITFLATTNIEVDVSLLNPSSRETIPGLTAVTAGQDYTISGVPNGTYLARATYRNDGKVMDPDWIIKNGEPYVTVSAGVISRPFSITGAVDLISPTNSPTSTHPVDVQTGFPLFSWQPYSSADEYVIEVINQNGTVIWGGFRNNWTVRKIVLPKTQTSVVFNVDSSATEQMVVGRMYRWKIYASKNDSGEPAGWKLISASEDQRGLVRISQ